MALDVAHDVRMVDLADVHRARWAYLTEEPADRGQMPDNAPRRQTAFSLEIVGEVRGYLILWGDPRWLCWRDETSIAQHRQEPLQCRAVARVDGPLPGSVSEKPFDHRFIDVGHLKATARHPIHEVANHTERPQSDSLSEPVFNETRRVTLDGLSVASVLKSSEWPAPGQVLFCNHHLSSAFESGGIEQTMPSRSNA